MDLQLRCIASHPHGGNPGTPLGFAFSSRSPRLVTACGDLLIDQSTSTNAIRASIRTAARVDKLLYVGGSCSFLAFMDNGYVASYAERVGSLQLVQERKIGGTGRSVTLGEGARFGRFALFCKADSPSLWCLHVEENGALMEPFKLRSDLEGDQDNVNFVGGVFAKVRGKVATKAKARICPIVAIATHPNLSLAAAAYTNGIVRVWDIARKEQRSHFDAQLLMTERIVDVALHPDQPVVVVCTTQGRIMTFYIKSVLYKRGDEPVLATSKTRDQKRQFRAICFLPGSPAYLMLLTASRRVVVRMIDKGSIIVNSSRYAKASKPLPVHESSVLGGGDASVMDETSGALTEGLSQACLSCEPAFGLIAASLDRSGNVYIFQPMTDGLPGIRRPISSGLDTGFSDTHGNAFKGPVLVHSDSLIVHRGILFRYELGTEQASQLCQLPPGDCYRIEIARDEYGYCSAALVFYHSDDEVNPAYGYAESEQSTRYVLCTRRGDTETWNASEPSEGRAGCFLNAAGRHDRIMILASTGTMVSLLSFAGSPQRDGGPPVRQSRGVQRFKLDGRRAARVFRTPFASWSAVMYHDVDTKQICVSRNAFERNSHSSSLRLPHSQSDSIADGELGMDDGTALLLREKEVVIDVRWQQLPTGSQPEQYLGAIMTDKRIYFIRDILQQISVFEFQSIDRIVVPFSPPSFSWVGPSVIVLFGNSLVSVTLDGRSDLIAGVSHGENVTTLVATLPDRVVYARPSPKHAMNAISIASRPYSAMSGLLRGVLSLPNPRDRTASHYTDKVQTILELQDVSQGSMELTKALIANDLSPIAYLLAVSQQGKFSMPPLRRAAFLGRMGDIRGALAIAEEEYTRLTHAKSFHEGTELYRLLQRVLNVAFASGDFIVGRRCSTLLGRKGTFSAFVEVEGGYAAVSSVADYARSRGNRDVADVLRPIIEKSSKSSIATDSSLIPSQRELQNIRRAIQAVDLSSIPLGERDIAETFITTPPGEDVNGVLIPATQTKLSPPVPAEVNDRLEMFRREVAFDVSTETEGEYQDLTEDDTEMSVQRFDTAKNDTAQGSAEQLEDSSDEEDLFATGRDELGGESSVGSSRTAVVQDTGMTQMIEQQREVTDNNIQRLKEYTAGPVEEGRQQTHELLLAQQLAEASGQQVPTIRANELIERGIRKLDDRRLSSAQKHFESALRVIARGRQRGQHTPVELIRQLVYYKLMAQVRIAMEEIRTSSHANSIAGKLTYAQLTTALTALPLRPKHRVEALIMATDANMITNNFGTAAQAMQAIKDIGVPNELRASLRDKYAACSARGFANAQPQPIPRLCYGTLRVITPGVQEMSCMVCPGRFLMDSGLRVGDTCPCCGCGTVRTL